MVWWLVVIVIVSVGALLYLRTDQNRRNQRELEDAQAEARVSIERLGGQVYQLSPRNEPARQALADAAERYNAASSHLDRADSPARAHLAEQTAHAGLHYIRAARTAMNMDPGPGVPTLDGQNIAGQVDETRTIAHNGRAITASPAPSAATPNYFPGGRVAGRPVPAGWYSEPWWKPALIAGAWGAGAALLFTTLFTGMPGVDYDTRAFEDGSGQASHHHDPAYEQPGYSTESPTPNPEYDTGTGTYDPF